MATKNVRTKIFLRNDKQANWKNIDPVLGRGEVAISNDLDPALFKIGDGEKAWSSLKYIGVAKESFDEISEKVSANEKAISDLQKIGAQANAIDKIKVNGDVAIPDAEKAISLIFAEGTSDGTISVNGKDVPVHGLDNLYDTKGSADALVGSDADTDTSDTIYGARKYADAKIKQALASVMTYKGTKEAVVDLPRKNNEVGDVWHVNDNAGEYAWNGTSWEPLGGSTDVSNLVTQDQLANYATVEGLVQERNERTALDQRVSTLELSYRPVSASETNGSIMVGENEVSVYDISKEGQVILNGGTATQRSSSSDNKEED